MGLSERLLKANPELQEQEVVTEGKKKPVQKTETDAPVQVNASNTASSGDSSAIVEGVDNYLNELGDNRETQVQRNIERQSEEEKPKVPLTKEKLAKKDKDFSTNLKPKIEARQKELFDSSPAMKRFSENFNKFSKADLEIKAKELIKKYPKASTDPGQEKSFYDELNNYRNTLWQEHISNSSTLIEEDKRISDIIDEEFQVDIDAYQVERKELLSDEYDRTSFFGNVFTEGSFADDLFTTIGIGGQRLINDLRGSAKSDQTLQVVSQAETTQKFLDSQLEKGFLTQEQYDERSAGVQSILEKQKIDRLKVIEDVGFQDEIERSVNKAVTDTDDKDFHSLSNYTLVVAEQLANTLPALAARSIGGNVTKAYAISAYAAQLYNEYEDKGLRAHLADELGIPPHEVSNEQLNEFAFTPRGRDIISEARVASVPAGALTYVTDSFQLGGAKALKPLTAAAAKISNKLRLTRLTTGRFNPIRLAGIPARGAASEIPEELTQQFIGDVVASRAVRKDLNIFQSISDAYTNINPKEYKDIAIISAIAGGGLSSASATPGEIIGAAKEYRSASNLKKLANLSEEDFQRYTANAKGRLSEVLNDTTADKQAKAEAYTSYVTLLDHEQGHNELKQFPAIKGKYKGKALQILAERAALDRDVKSSPGTGLAANAKERIKAIDEQLQSIEGRARRGYKSTALEKIRSLVGPRRSVGAQRAANLPQKLVDKVEEVLQFTSDLGEAARRLSPLKSEFNLTDENFDNIISTLGKEFQQSGSVGLFEYLESKQKQEEQSREGFEPTKETKAVNQLPKNITPEGTDTIAQAQQEKIEDFYHNEGLAVPANVAKRFETPYSEPINVVAEGQQNPYLGDAGSLDEAVSRVVNFSANKGDILRQALQQASRSEKIGNRSNAAQGIRNEGWIPNRIKKQIKTAESLRKDLLKNHSQNGAEIIAALDEFIDLKYAVDGLVRQYVNESLESKDVGQKRGRVRQGIAEWDRAIDDTLNIADAVSRGGIDTQTKKAFQTELSDRLAYLEKLYAYGLVQVEKQIALQGAKEGQYPPMFNPATGRFEFNFNNKFGNSVIYDLFPSNGEVTFENLPLKDWAYTVVKYNIAQTKTGDAYTKFMARARDHAQKVFAKGSSKNLKDIQEVDAKEQRAITAALKILETGDVVRKDTLPTLVKDTDIATTDQKEEEAVQKAFDSLRAEIDTVAIGSEGEFDYNLAQAYIDTKLLEGGSDVQVKALNRIIKGQSAEAGSLNTQNIQDLKGDRSKYATKSTDKLKEVHKDRPIIRWEAMAKDPRISLEGDILHMIYVQGASQILTEDQADFLNDSQIIDFFNTPTSPLANIDAQNDISSKLQAIESVRGWDYIDDMYSEHIKLTEQLHSLQRGDSELALEGVGQENLLGEKLQRAISDYIELVGKTEAIAFLRGSAGLQYKTDLVTKAQNGNEVAMQALIDSYSDFLKLTIQEYVPEWHNEDNNKFGFTRNPATGALESVRSGDDVWQTWDSVSLAGPSIGDFEGTARNATRKAIFYYDATKGKLGTYIQNVVRGAIVAQLNGETISWNPVRKQIKAQQARAKLELTQQIYYDSIIGDGDITLIGEEGIGPKVLTEDQIKFLHELPNSKAKRDIAVTKQRIADTKKVIEISEGNTKIRLENKLHLLNARLGEQQSNEVVSESLPAIADNFQNSAGWTEGSKELNIVNVANLVAQGNAVDIKIDLIDLPGELTLDQYKQHLLLLEGSNRTLEQLQEKVANFSADIKSMGLARDINEGISATQLQNIEEARAKQKQLQQLKGVTKSQQLAAAKIVAAVGLGKIQVDGLKASEKLKLEGGEFEVTDLSTTHSQAVVVVKDGLVVPTTSSEMSTALEKSVNSLVPATQLVQDLIDNVDSKYYELQKAAISLEAKEEEVLSEWDAAQDHYDYGGIESMSDSGFGYDGYSEFEGTYDSHSFASSDDYSEDGGQDFYSEELNVYDRELVTDASLAIGFDYGGLKEDLTTVTNSIQEIDNLGNTLDAVNNMLLAIGDGSYDKNDADARKVYLKAIDIVHLSLGIIENSDDFTIKSLAKDIKLLYNKFDNEPLLDERLEAPTVSEAIDDIQNEIEANSLTGAITKLANIQKTKEIDEKLQEDSNEVNRSEAIADERQKIISKAKAGSSQYQSLWDSVSTQQKLDDARFAQTLIQRYKEADPKSKDGVFNKGNLVTKVQLFRFLTNNWKSLTDKGEFTLPELVKLARYSIVYRIGPQPTPSKAKGKEGEIFISYSRQERVKEAFFDFLKSIPKTDRIRAINASYSSSESIIVSRLLKDSEITTIKGGVPSIFNDQGISGYSTSLGIDTAREYAKGAYYLWNGKFTEDTIFVGYRNELEIFLPPSATLDLVEVSKETFDTIDQALDDNIKNCK